MERKRKAKKTESDYETWDCVSVSSALFLFVSCLFGRCWVYPRIKISVSMDISVLEFYGYIGYIDEYFYMNIDI